MNQATIGYWDCVDQCCLFVKWKLRNNTWKSNQNQTHCWAKKNIWKWTCRLQNVDHPVECPAQYVKSSHVSVFIKALFLLLSQGVKCLTTPGQYSHMWQLLNYHQVLLKRKCHCDWIFITRCTGSCHVTISSAVSDENLINIMMTTFLFQCSSNPSTLSMAWLT